MGFIDIFSEKNVVKKIVCFLLVVVLINITIPTSYGEAQNSSLRLLTSSPQSNALNVGTKEVLTLEFNKPIKEGYRYSEISLVTDSTYNPVPYSLMMGHERMFVIPEEELEYDKSYHLFIPIDAVLGEFNEALEDDIHLSFHTITYFLEKNSEANESINIESLNETANIVSNPSNLAFRDTNKRLAAGNKHSVVVKSDGTVWTWGSNSNGQLGDGSTTQSLTPVQVKGPNGLGYLTNIVSVSARNNHTLALKSDGTVWAWGYGGYGQLGYGQHPSSQSTPVQVKDANGTGFLTNVIAIDTGAYHSIAVKEDGSVWAWGNNSFGQLGDNSNNGSPIPKQVKGPNGIGYLSNVISVSTTDVHSLALISDGTVWSWGQNNNGQLGNGNKVARPYPGQVLGENGIGFLTNVIAISSGNQRNMALLNDGTLWSWGHNGSGQLGNGTFIFSDTPVPVINPSTNNPMSGIRSFSGTIDHVMANMEDGTVRAWGRNNYGQLGDGSLTTKNSPTSVMNMLNNIPLNNALEITTGTDHSIAILIDGSVQTWGRNDAGQLGNGSVIDTQYPTSANIIIPQELSLIQSSPYEGQTGVNINSSISFTFNNEIIAGTNYNNILINSDGSNVSFNKLIQDNTLQLIPSSPLRDLSSVEVTIPVNALINEYGSQNKSIVLGFNTGSQLVPNNNQQIAVSGGFTVVLKSDGTVWAWGENSNGQLGNGTNDYSSTMTQVKSQDGTGYLTDIVSIASTHFHTLALKSDGTVWAWGYNGYGALGDGSKVSKGYPVQVKSSDRVSPLTDVIAISTGYYHSVALKSDGTIWTWGYNSDGQLGNNSTNETNYPTQVLNESGTGYLSDIVGISSNTSYTLALKSDGTVWAWGKNNYYQLGDGTTTNRTLPNKILGLEEISSISAGVFHGIALKSDGTVWSWGNNFWGQLGDNTRSDRLQPIQVKGENGIGYLNNVTSVKADSFSMALMTNGTVMTWGSNDYGELGQDLEGSYRLVPGQVKSVDGLGTLNDVSSISVGRNIGFVMKTDGALLAWGKNDAGQLKNGSRINAFLPSIVNIETNFRYLYNARNQLTTLFFNKGLIVYRKDYVYDANGNLTGISAPIKS